MAEALELIEEQIASIEKEFKQWQEKEFELRTQIDDCRAEQFRLQGAHKRLVALRDKLKVK